MALVAFGRSFHVERPCVKRVARAAAAAHGCTNDVSHWTCRFGREKDTPLSAENARWLETLGYLNIQLAYVVGHGADTGFRYIH